MAVPTATPVATPSPTARAQPRPQQRASAVVGADIVARPSEAAAAMAMKVFFIVRVSWGERTVGPRRPQIGARPLVGLRGNKPNQFDRNVKLTQRPRRSGGATPHARGSTRIT